MSKKLEETLSKLNKTFGTGTVMQLSEKPTIDASMLISTGSLLIDKILGGGVARGRIAEIYGVPSAGKSTLCLQLVREAQLSGLKVAFLDAEQALDPKYARKLGVKVEDLIFAQPNSGEQALEIAEALARTGEVGLIIVDSVAALTPQAVLDGEMGDAHIGQLARLLSQGCGKLISTLNQSNCALVFINQIRAAINTGYGGPSEVTSGGNALKFYASQRIELRKSTAIKQGEDVIGNNVKVKIVKNKIDIPMRSVVIPFIFGKGFSADEEVYQLAIEFGLIEKSGAWFTTSDGQRLQGLAKVKDYYTEHKDLYDELYTKVKSMLANTEIEETYDVNPETGEIIS